MKAERFGGTGFALHAISQKAQISVPRVNTLLSEGVERGEGFCVHRSPPKKMQLIELQLRC